MVACLSRIALALLMPFALASCVLAPGKFVSTLRIDADRHFTFTYIGEVIAIDLSNDLSKGFDGASPDGKTASFGDTGGAAPKPQKLGFQAAGRDETKDKAAESAAKKAEADRKNRAIAEALSKEAGYRKVAYLGNGKFSIDYAISGTLDHGFVYPYNLDAEIMFPFVVVEVRANNTVRVKAPGYAADNNEKSVPGTDKASSQLDGVFTLDTNAEIVSLNNEEGAVTAGGRKTVTWKATPLSKDPPTAVLRLAPVK